MNIKGIVLKKNGNQYDVRLENSSRNTVQYIENITGLELNIGDIVIVTYTEYNDPPIITNVYNKTISGADSYTKTETDTLLDYKVDKDGTKVLSDNNYTTTEKNKLSDIASGAEVNIQADWNQTNNTQDDYIKNKPTIPTEETANSILTKLLTVDGAGSGLDADLLDGYNSDYFATASTVSSIPVINTGTFVISSVTANTSATTDITMPSAASYFRCVFWSSSAVGAYFIQVQSATSDTWTIRHRFEATSTNRTVYYAWW